MKLEIFHYEQGKSVELLQEGIEQPHYKKLFMITDTLKEHSTDLLNYFAEFTLFLPLTLK